MAPLLNAPRTRSQYRRPWHVKPGCCSTAAEEAAVKEVSQRQLHHHSWPQGQVHNANFIIAHGLRVRLTLRTISRSRSIFVFLRLFFSTIAVLHHIVVNLLGFVWLKHRWHPSAKPLPTPMPDLPRRATANKRDHVSLAAGRQGMHLRATAPAELN